MKTYSGNEYVYIALLSGESILKMWKLLYS